MRCASCAYKTAGLASSPGSAPRSSSHSFKASPPAIDNTRKARALVFRWLERCYTLWAEASNSRPTWARAVRSEFRCPERRSRPPNSRALRNRLDPPNHLLRTRLGTAPNPDESRDTGSGHGNAIDDSDHTMALVRSRRAARNPLAHFYPFSPACIFRTLRHPKRGARLCAPSRFRFASTSPSRSIQEPESDPTSLTTSRR